MNPSEARKKETGIIFALLLLWATELMFFAGLISAYIVARASISVWPPQGQPRLPVEITAVNTLILLASGVLAYLIIRKRETVPVRLYLLTALLGLVFILVQGFEWIRLISFGLTTVSSLYGAFFYLIVGAHALHAAAGLIALLVGMLFYRTPIYFLGSAMYWIFVAGIWPFLYVLVYLY